MDDLKDLASMAEALTREVDAVGIDEPLAGAGSLDRVRRYLGRSPDIVLRRVGGGAMALYLRTVVDLTRLEQSVIQPLESGGRVPWAAECRVVSDIQQAASAVLSGACLVADDTTDGAIAFPLPHWPVRSPTEPPSEKVVDGPHNGFVEDLSTNIALIRQQIQRPDLRWENCQLQGKDESYAALLYLQGTARPDTVRRVRKALRRVNLQFLTDALMLRLSLAASRGRLFPVVDNTSRVDLACAAIQEGRVVLLLNASPVALMMPVVFFQLLHAAEDYYHPRMVVTMIRIFRLMGLSSSLLASATYIALVSINQELVPTPLFTSIIASRLSVPLSPVLEVLVLEVIIEFIELAGLRLPGSLGQAVSIVGAVIIGQSAVMAGLVSAPSIVVVAFAFIVGFCVPSRDARLSMRLIRYPMILLAAAFGVYGIGWGVMVFIAYLASLSSFGVPYLAPVAPVRTRGAKDALSRPTPPGSRLAFTARLRRRRRPA